MPAIGKGIGHSVNSPRHVPLRTAHLAALYEQEQHYYPAEQELEIALRHESEPDGRSKLLAQRLRVEHLAGAARQGGADVRGSPRDV